MRAALDRTPVCQRTAAVFSREVIAAIDAVVAHAYVIQAPMETVA
jgi:hypothetical protein